MMRMFPLFIVFMIAGCDLDLAGPSSGNTPQEMFTYVIQSPLPASVKNLQGVGDTWQGYSLYLRFTASDVDIDSIIATGYKLAKWDDIAWRFSLPEGYDRFEPSWSPSTIQTKECYSAPASNDWTGSGTHYLVIDRGTGTVYFYGVGA